MDIILFVIIHFLVCTLIINIVLLWLQRCVNTRPRIYLMIFALVCVLSLAYRLYVTYMVGVPNSYAVLSTASLSCGFFELLLLYFYPIEVARPNSLTFKRVLLLFLPWLILNLILITVPIKFRVLSSFSQILEYVGEFNVWFRLLIIFVCIIPYTVTLFYIPLKLSQNSVDKGWLYKYVLGVQGMGLLYCMLALTGSVVVSSIHLLYGALFCMYITYHELFLRITPGGISLAAKAEDIATDNVMPEDIAADKINEIAVRNPLMEKLIVMMDEQELWREPDLMLDDLARRLCTNRTTLTGLIQQCGYAGYTEFINRKRIKAFVDEVEKGKLVNIQDSFYDVGFRSKSTALRNFRLYMGCTPSDYIRRRVSMAKTKQTL